jgi:hypothetical protein
LLSELGHEVIVAHARNVRLINNCRYFGLDGFLTRPSSLTFMPSDLANVGFIHTDFT